MSSSRGLLVFTLLLVAPHLCSAANPDQPAADDDVIRDFRELDFSFRGGCPELLGWNPWKVSRSHPILARFFRWTRSQPLLCDFWSYREHWGYTFTLRTYSRRGRFESECKAVGASQTTTSNVSVRHGDWEVGCSIETRWGGVGLPKSPTRHFVQELTVEGKKIKRQCAEAAAELPIYRRNISFRITYLPRKTVVWKWEWANELTCKMVLRACRGDGWNYAKVMIGKKEGGPGWFRVPKDKSEGGFAGPLNWTDSHEEYGVQWFPW
jgi:hypothetical protein